MKKYLLCFLYILFINMLLGCSPSCTYEFLQHSSNIEKIEIVDVAPFYNHIEGGPEIINVIKEIVDAEQEDFLEAFLRVPCYRYFGDRKEYIGGEAIRIIYLDGSFELIDIDTVYIEFGDGQWNILSYHFNEHEFEKFTDLQCTGVI